MNTARQAKNVNLPSILVILLAVSVLVSSFAANVFAATASLSWTAPTTYTNGAPITSLGGYTVYTGTTSGSYSQNVNVGNVTSYTVSGLNNATAYYFAVTAYDASGDVSGYSSQASYTTPAAPPPTPTYTITASAGSGGSITPSGAVAISQGLSQSFSIAPNSGYQIAAVTVDGASVGAVTSYTFSNVAANHTISATFTANVTSYKITASAGTGGSVSPAGTATVSSGGSQTYTIAPATGYQIAAVTVDGTSVGAVSSYAFSNVTANHTIAATFTATTATTYSIAATSMLGGTISPAGTSQVAAGKSLKYTITPATGFKIAYVLVDGVSVGAVSSYTFSNVTANHTIAVGFYVFAVNCGGAQYAASTYVTYGADSNYSSGATASVTNAITGTSDSTLYQSWRYGTNFSYNVPVANGNYNVKLKFSENLYSAAGERVFNVLMQGNTVISNLDIYAAAKNFTAYDVTIPVSVTNGELNINFVGVTGSAMVNGILITAQ